MPKSTRAIKVTDKNKPWNKKAEKTYYRVDQIPANKVILITCEGQTEKYYFESFPVIGLTVSAVDLHGQSKTKLIEVTEEIVRKSEIVFDKVFCVFDMDIKRGKDELSDFDNSISKAIGLDYCPIYSNDTFELWFYLHFVYNDSKDLRGFYYDKLSQYLDINYVKEGKTYKYCNEIYKILNQLDNSSQEEAIKRAKKLYEKVSDLPYHLQHPVTLVYKLVEYLNENLRK